MTPLPPRFRPVLITAALLAITPAWSQTAPDAGQLLQEQRPLPLPPRPNPDLNIQRPTTSPPAPGGARVTLTGLHFTGNSIFTEETLRAALGGAIGQAYDLAGLRYLADQVAAYYRGAGYPFASTFLPPQSLTDGVLQIIIVEGRYGQVQAKGEPRLAQAAQAFITPIEPGSVIESTRLERTMLILDDLPGLKAVPVIRPGQELGTGDLDVNVASTDTWSGEVGLDNHGNRYTGTRRLRANLQWDSPLMVGDQFVLRSLYTEESMWMGSLGYNLPLGASGLRGNVGYSRTSYQLAKEFSRLDATGTAEVASLGLSYPLVRSQKSNLTLAVTYQHKWLNDKQNATGSDDSKHSDSLPLAANFDHRDGLGGGGITYGALTYTPGRLNLDSTLEAQDRASGRNKRGHFDKWNLDVARLQLTPWSALSFYGRASAQWAGKNLDSSEGFILGGPNGVRTYPVSEGAGDACWLALLEVRYSLGDFVPFAFYDAGKVTLNAKPDSLVVPVARNSRTLAGAGVGLRYQHGNASVDTSVAWRSEGGKPQSRSEERRVGKEC